MPKIAWLCFDLGGTLVDESAQERAMIASACGALAAEGIDVAPDAFYRLMIEASIAYKTPYREAIRLCTSSPEQFERVRAAARYPAELARLYSGVPELLAALSAKYRLGVIANLGPGIEEYLEGLGIRRYFSVLAGSGDVGFSKPDPTLFRWALEKAGCAPERAAMVGDRLDNDIYPAKQLGLATVWVKQGIAAHQTPKSADYTPDDTIERIGKLERLF